MNTKTISTMNRKISLLLTLFLGSELGQAAEYCSDEYYLNVTLPNQARWDMCWEHRAREGIVLHKMHYTPPHGQRLQILNLAALAQIHVPYDDNGARYHDISDYGLGNQYMASLTTSECPNGRLLNYAGKSVICQQITPASSGYATVDKQLHGDALSLFSVSTIGAYNYIPTWRFLDDGSIEALVGATGALQRYGTMAASEQGWLVADNKVGISHTHNFFWKLDFDLAGTANDDYVEELNFTPNQAGQLARNTTRFNQEAGRSVNPEQLRRWRIVDGAVKNAKGLPISYEVRLPQSVQREDGPAIEAFNQYDFYVTRQKTCELFASHNPTGGACAASLNAFANNESLANQDLVLWPSTTFYHVPRAEDSPRMDAHWSSIAITPRDLNDINPLTNSQGGGTGAPIALGSSGGGSNAGSGGVSGERTAGGAGSFSVILLGLIGLLRFNRRGINRFDKAFGR
ncbi:hypothetical protein [Thiolinea disciformis]|uniref:copper amine oxidase n=1 Tax=Thiolinea disciformis TaxID=125614 RepID=UPI00036CFDCF|nr:hypothetical protein [Thiolinea disciformis]